MLRRAALALAAGLAACAPVAVPPAPPPVAAPPPETPASAAMRAHFAAVQGTLLSRGLLRTDSGATDAPFSDWQLTENFIRIALFDEFQPGPGGYVQQERESRLRRWVAPVRVAVRFGASVPLAQQQDRRASVAAYLARLASITGHPIRLDPVSPNFFVYVVSEDERRALAPQIAAAMPGFSAAEIAAFTAMPQSTYCQVSVLSESASGIYLRAFAVIRAEHPDLMFRACVNEEIAQGLGLPNDSPRARPSVFNDDQEFALLTPMDALLLRILYNPALRPGMTAAEARPIVAMLARALTGGGA
jgi:hypothetical protein